ncbi:MAG: hypothetical protein DMH00_05075, partial [Acidobacteria bacterium]
MDHEIEDFKELAPRRRGVLYAQSPRTFPGPFPFSEDEGGSEGSAESLAPTDNELVVRCLQRDEVAWQLLVERHSRRVLNIAYQFTGRREEAEELAQEIFLRVFRSLHRFDLNTHFVPWLARVGRNLCIDEHRSRAREKASLVGNEPDPERTEDRGASPFRHLEARDRERRV